MSAALATTEPYGLRRGRSPVGQLPDPEVLIVEADPKQFASRWQREALTRLSELLKLGRDWDGNRAERVSESTAYFTLELLSQLMRPNIAFPDILPLAYGGLQIEWHKKGWDLEIEIVRPNEIDVWVHELETGQEVEFRLAADVSKLHQYTSKIAD